jgi:hypothetical protein
MVVVHHRRLGKPHTRGACSTTVTGVNFTQPFPTLQADIDCKGLVRAADEYAVRIRAFYHARATWHRVFHRVSGILIILVGAGLPVLTNLDYPGKATVISLAGMAVAVLTAMHAFYRWDQSWIVLRNTEGAITAAYWSWRAEVIAAGDNEDECRTKTTEFLGMLANIRTKEATDFFANVSFPANTAATRQ